MAKLDVVRAAAWGTVLPSEARYKYVIATRAKPGMTAIQYARAFSQLNSAKYHPSQSSNDRYGEALSQSLSIQVWWSVVDNHKSRGHTLTAVAETHLIPPRFSSGQNIISNIVTALFGLGALGLHLTALTTITQAL
ncbi:hypothetical protein OG21DRAFT_1525348 [Imleria badia]|nr:hypothetical protein OG21DRAFT_1525348 [Imleria badia]